MAEQSILLAKVGVLENIVLLVLRQEILRQPDPNSALDAMAVNMRASMEALAADNPKESAADLASVITLEVFDSFFDRVRAVVEAALDQRDQS